MPAAQPAVVITAWANGANTNWPNEPPALITPAAIERFCSLIRCATAPIRTEKLPAPAPAAPRMPRVSTKPHCDVSIGASAMPETSNTPPNTSTRPGPRLSAQAPKIGCAAPQISCAMASAKLICAIDRPVPL